MSAELPTIVGKVSKTTEYEITCTSSQDFCRDEEMLTVRLNVGDTVFLRRLSISSERFSQAEKKAFIALLTQFVKNDFENALK